MNLRHIEIFHAVYVNGSVSAAARALNVSQPSVSKMLRHAETLLGFQLFERTAGGLVATEDAHALFAEVSEIQDRVYALREAGRNLKRGTGGTLRISALPSLALDALPTAVSRFLRTHENVKFDLQTVHHDDLLRKLYERETDVAIAYEVPPAAPIGHRWLGEGELVVLYREQDMPDAPASIELERLSGKPFISLTASGPIGHLFAQELQRLELDLPRSSPLAPSTSRRRSCEGCGPDGGGQLHGAGLARAGAFDEAAKASGRVRRPCNVPDQPASKRTHH
jgi:DNA-binding transcriptional LysR family regulator